MARPVGETEDLALLGDLTEEILLAEIESRYAKDKIYVRTYASASVPQLRMLTLLHSSPLGPSPSL